MWAVSCCLLARMALSISERFFNKSTRSELTTSRFLFLFLLAFLLAFLFVAAVAVEEAAEDAAVPVVSTSHTIR